jgi:hypothetical protein
MAHAATSAPPSTLIDWLTGELDNKLSSLPDDQARYRHLILCANAWRLKYARFADFGTQPFNEPHPVYGDMDAFDFALLLADLELRKAMLERARVLA